MPSSPGDRDLRIRSAPDDESVMRDHISGAFEYIGKCALWEISELYAPVGQPCQVRQGVVLVAVHEHPRQGKREKALQQPAVVGQVQHRFEDRPHREPGDPGPAPHRPQPTLARRETASLQRIGHGRGVQRRELRQQGGISCRVLSEPARGDMGMVRPRRVPQARGRRPARATEAAREGERRAADDIPPWRRARVPAPAVPISADLIDPLRVLPVQIRPHPNGSGRRGGTT